MVIKALGFDPEDLPNLFDSSELQVTKWGTIKTDFDTMETNIKGVFAAGDIVRGASLVVWAIKDGRDAAASIKTYLESKSKVEKIIVDQIKLGDPDETGRRKPEVQEGSSYETKADMVIKALGFDPEDLPNLFDSSELQVTKWGTIKTDFDTMETNIKGVFAEIGRAHV